MDTRAEEARPSLEIPVHCLEPHDLAVAKLAAGRPKDTEYVGARLAAGLLDAERVRARAEELDASAHPWSRGDVLRRLAALTQRD